MNDASNPVHQRIQQEIDGNNIVLFMKGSPAFPMCGFSAAVVQVLNNMGVQYKGIDVLTDPSLRQGIKEFSDWPTIPQLYVKGEFIGGCDIVREMQASGELASLFQDKGVPFRFSAIWCCAPVRVVRAAHRRRFVARLQMLVQKANGLVI
jgi:monothiol glutaredoxin